MLRQTYYISILSVYVHQQDEPSSLASSIYIDPALTCDPTPISVAPPIPVDVDTSQPAVRWRTCIARPMNLSPLTPRYTPTHSLNQLQPTQVCVQLPSSADNVMLLAFAGKLCAMLLWSPAAKLSIDIPACSGR